MRTGILGGTFDPIHIAHLHAGEVAKAQALLDRVLFVPARDPWQKRDTSLTAPGQRLAMTRLAVAGVEGFEADDREMTRDGATYTAETLDSFPDDEELFLILGADAALNLPSWHRVDDVLARTTILVVPRRGVANQAVSATVPDAVFLEMGMLDVSGTRVREMARNGEPYRFLVTETVYAYILKNGLYTQS